jgi:flagellar biosynthesis/type III secretory pathway protein FliH
MALIRQSLAQTMAREAVVLDLGDLVRQGEQIKARARAEADRIVAEAKAERDRLIAGAAEEGRTQGLARGMEEGRKQGEAAGRLAALAELRERLGTLEKGWAAGLAAFEAERERMLLDAKTDILRLAATVAEMVTKRRVELEPAAVTDQVVAVLALLTRPTRLTIAVNPEDEAVLREALPAICQRFSAATHVEMTPDAAIARGGCIARTSGGGVIDATVTTQLERIVQTLLPGAPPPAPAGDDA